MQHRRVDAQARSTLNSRTVAATAHGDHQARRAWRDRASRCAFEASLPSGSKRHPIPATAAGGKCQGSLKPHATPCLSLAFDLCRVGSHTAASLPCLAVGAPSSAPQARGSGSPTHPSMSGGVHLPPYPRSAPPSLVPSKDDPRGSGVFDPVCRSRRLDRFFRHLVDALRERCSQNEAYQ
jgi:hypothetical protein